jgi:hypothetical protein
VLLKENAKNKHQFCYIGIIDLGLSQAPPKGVHNLVPRVCPPDFLIWPPKKSGGQALGTRLRNSSSFPGLLGNVRQPRSPGNEDERSYATVAILACMQTLLGVVVASLHDQ